MRPARIVLDDILRHIDYLQQFVADGEDTFIHDIKTQFAVRLAYQLIGDMVKQLPESLLALQPQINWRDLKGMREILAHQYFQLDLEIVWNSTDDLPALRAAVEALLTTLPLEDEDAS